MVVYFHRNPVTGIVFYVGIGQRRRAGESAGRNIIWNNYVRKYGRPVIEIIHENLTKSEAYFWEKHYILKYKRKKEGGTLANITAGGENNPMHNEECRLKVVAANTGKRASIETKMKQSLLKKGKPSNQPKGYRHSPEVIARLKIINKEIATRPETIERIRTLNIGRRNTGKHRPVFMIDPKNNNIVIKFDCARDAGKYFGKPNTGNIASACNGKRNFAFGYKWQYAA